MYVTLLLVMLAPAPIVKAPATPTLQSGTYVMTWHGVDALTVFHADGFYACQWHGCWWHGQWKMDKGQLLVEEWPMNEPHRRSTWTIKLKCKMTGNFSGGTIWKVVPAAPPGGGA